MNNTLALKLLYTLAAASVAVLVAQYAFQGRIDCGVLMYVLPIAAGAYMAGEKDGMQRRLANRSEKE